MKNEPRGRHVIHFLMAACAGGVLGLVPLARATPVINEIHYNPPDNTVRQEFIEIHNPADTAVELSGWRLSGGVDYVFTNDATIPARGYLLIAEDPATIQATFQTNALGPYTGSLNADGETVRLRDAADNVVDEVDYRVGFPWPVAANGRGASIELINPALDNALGSSWRASSEHPEALGRARLLHRYAFEGNAADSIGNADLTLNGGASVSGGALVLPGGGTRANNAVVPSSVGTELRAGAAMSVEVWFRQDTAQTWAKLFMAGSDTSQYLDITARRGTDGGVSSACINDGGHDYESNVKTSAVLADGVDYYAAAVWDADANRVTLHIGRVGGTLATYSATMGGQSPADINMTQIYIGSAVGFGDPDWDGRIDELRLWTGALTAAEVADHFAGGPSVVPRVEPMTSPGGPNHVYATNAPPNIRKVAHAPRQPAATNAVTITALITDPDGVDAVTLEYQLVAPGAYIPAFLPHAIVNRRIPDIDQPRTVNPAYTNSASWTTTAMHDDGTNGDAIAGDGVYTVVLPPQPHRTLVRYRITVNDAVGCGARVPYPDDDSLNFAYFVYDGVPDFNGHAAATLTTLPVYHVITRAEDWTECYAWNDSSKQILQGEGYLDRLYYNWNGTIVYDGVVYDNIRYRLRGANGRYHLNGKRSMRFRLNDGYHLQARDQNGRKYGHPWRTLTTSKGFENRLTLTYGLNEAVNLYLWRQLGLPAQYTLWVHWRVIDGADEAPDQWHGDFWGLNMLLETADVNFLEEHEMPKGNLYKLINQETSAAQQLRYQAAFAPARGEDHDNIEQNLTGYSGETFIRANVGLDRYYLYKGLSEAVRNYDFWPSANKNMIYYFYPDYTADNGYRGRLWILPYDTDASWGPSWNSGHDVVYNALFPATGAGADSGSTPTLWPEYFNTIRGIRDLLWQPDQLEPVIERFAAAIAAFIPADADRWKGAPADAGNYSGLGGAGMTSLDALVQDMKNFAFTGGSWPGGNSSVLPQANDSGLSGSEGRDAFLDWLQASNGEGGLVPATPAVSYSGTPGYPTDGLVFRATAFDDPQGSATFAGIEWRLAEITDPTAPDYDPAEPLKLEITPVWESGTLTTNTNPKAIPAAAVHSGRTYRLRARYLDAGGRYSHWSVPVEFTAALPDISGYTNDLVITEIMYHPPDPTASERAAGFDDDNAFEFVELYNAGALQLDLTNVRFTRGIDFDFAGSAVTTLEPGAYVLVVANAAAFALRYGAGLPVAGEWEANDGLDNGGERLKLSYGGGDPIRDFSYDDDAPWPTPPDGRGPSLTLINPASRPSPADPASWKASFAWGGTPGAARIPEYAGRPVYVNEVLPHTDLPQVDAIELHNPNAVAVDIGGWWLTDNPDSPKKFRIPAGSVIAAGGYWVVNEDNDDIDGSAPEGYFGSAFQIDSHGESVYLYSADAGGNLTGYRHGFAFRGSENGVSFGRYVDGAGREHFPAQRAVTFAIDRFTPNPAGAPNAGPRVGPVVLSELRFLPTAGTPEFVELHNITAATVPLYDDTPEGEPTHTWELLGTGFRFPVPLPALAPGATAVLLPYGTDAAAFRASNAVPAEVAVFGGDNGYPGALANDGEELALVRPDHPDVIGGVTRVAMIVVDSVTYATNAPWPAATGRGASLERIVLRTFGDDPANWRAVAASNASPGRVASYGLWASRAFTAPELAAPGMSGPADDANGDGYNNLHAYAFGYDPHGAPPPEVALRAAVRTNAGHRYFAVSYRRPRSAPDLLYAIDLSTNLPAWTHTDSSAVETLPPVPVDTETETAAARIAIPTNSPTHRALRLRATWAP